MHRIKWQQSEFSSWDLRKNGFWEALCEQRSALQGVESAAEEGNPILISAAVAELDLDLLRYASAELYRQLAAAAKSDCAELLAMSVTGNESDNVQKKWESWLAGGAVWSVLLKKQWRDIKNRAVKQVCLSIQKVGPVLGDAIVKEI